LNRHTPLFASRLKRAGIRISVFTNGQAFTDENISELADAEIDCIRFSVDGASESTYGKNRVGGRFETVYTNMKKVRLAHEGKNTRIEWQFLALKNNEHEIPEARKLADRLGVHFFVKGFRETDPALAPENPKYRARRLQKPCTDIYLQLGIYWNGDVVPCCYDVDAHEVMGNVLENDLKTIWRSPKYRDFRRRVDRAHTRPSNEPCLCRHCLRWGP
jgi:radical SAM protein with 4Fe4S-binding SPASM domain